MARTVKTQKNFQNKTCNPIEDWIKAKGWELYPHQISTFNEINRGNNVILNSPTGSGKTLAGFMPAIVDFINSASSTQLHTIYISPLKALAADVKRNLINPINDLNINIKVETRTSDTSAYIKKRQTTTPPDFLMTTPESLSLLMTSTNASTMFSNLRFIIIDEIHSFMNSKRGHLLTLNLARLQTFCSPKLIALSATITSKSQVKNYISSKKHTVFISAKQTKVPKIEILKTKGRIPWSGHSPRYALSDIYKEILNHSSSILFVNTRAQAEILFESLWSLNDNNIRIAIHHGSLEKTLRQKVEDEIISGSVRCVVATSALDLGLDWGNIDLVMQIGAPKGVSRLIQRIGRANHTIEKSSKAILVPTNCFEYVECIAAKQNIEANSLETETILQGSLDVLAQFIVSVAISGNFNKDELFQITINAWPYRSLSMEIFDKVLSFVENGGYSLKKYDRFARVVSNNGIYSLRDKSIILKHKMNIGTIVEADMMRLKVGNKFLGSVEEWFIAGLTPGDTFIFGGKKLRFEKVVGNIAFSKVTNLDHKKIPSYNGGNLPLSTHLSSTVRKLFETGLKSIEVPEEVQKWLMLQGKFSIYPKKNELLVERFKRKEKRITKFYLAIYPFEGRNMHQTLGFLILRRIKRLGVQPFGFVANDYAILISFAEEISDVHFLLSEELLIDDLYEWLEETPLLKRLFREVAMISGLIYKKLPGSQKTGKQITFNTDLIFDVLRKHEPDHILLKTTLENAKDSLIDIKRLASFIDRIKDNINVQCLQRASALAFPLLFEYNTEVLNKTDLDNFYLERLEHSLLKEIDAV